MLKGTRWLLLKNPENLDDKHDERKRLEEALTLNKPLATVYYMKEDLRQIWDQQDKSAARVFIDDWIARAQSSGIRMLQKFAVTLAEHRSGILTTMTARSPRAHWKGPTTRSRRCSARPMAFETTSSSSSRSTPPRNYLRINRMSPKKVSRISVPVFAVT